MAPPVPQRSPLRRSQGLRKVPPREGNIYGEDRPPIAIEKDIARAKQWEKLLDLGVGSSQQPQIPGGFESDSEDEAPLPQPIQWPERVVDTGAERYSPESEE